MSSKANFKNAKSIDDLGLAHWMFWDTDPTKIELGRDKNYVITRVVHRGDIEDFKAIENRYSREEMIGAITETRDLPERIVIFYSAYYDLPIEDFRAHHFNQLPNAYWKF